MKEPIDTHALPESETDLLVGGLQEAAKTLAGVMANPRATEAQMAEASELLMRNKALQMKLSKPVIQRAKAEQEKQKANAAKGPLTHPPTRQNRKARRSGGAK